jgi:organic radical activating enzyme
MIPHSNKFDLTLDREQWIKDNPSVCVAPYAETQYRLNYISPCCHYDARGTESNGINRFIIQVKSNIESGFVDKSCNFCHSQESRGQLSGRVRDLISYNSEQIVDFLKNKKIKEHTDVFTFGNKCNMACRMCNEKSSSLYDSIWNRKKNINIESISLNAEYWEHVKSDIRYKIENTEIYRIIVTGGEGTIQDDLYKLTDWLIGENLSHRVHLRIATNGSVFLDEIFDNWCKKFKHLEFGISIDSTHADNFRYVRYPVKFEKIHQNLKKFTQLSETYHNVNILICPTFYINNIAYLKDFLDYFKNSTMAIRDGTLTNPIFLRLASLPTAIKQQLVDQLTPLVNGYKFLDLPVNRIFKLSIKVMIDQLRIDAYSEEVWKKYLSTSAKWDCLTKTDISVHNKKLWDLFSSDDKDLYYQYKYDFINRISQE